MFFRSTCLFAALGRKIVDRCLLYLLQTSTGPVGIYAQERLKFMFTKKSVLLKKYYDDFGKIRVKIALRATYDMV